MAIPNTTYRVLVEKLGDSDPSQFVGNKGEVFYDPNNSILKLSDGTTAGGVSVGGTESGVQIQENGSPVGTVGTINFGDNLSVDFSDGVVTIDSIEGGGGEFYWSKTSVGIHTLSNVGIGTTNPNQKLDILGTVKATSFVGNGSGLTNVVAIGLTGTPNIGVTSVTAQSIKLPSLVNLDSRSVNRKITLGNNLQIYSVANDLSVPQYSRIDVINTPFYIGSVDKLSQVGGTTIFGYRNSIGIIPNTEENFNQGIFDSRVTLSHNSSVKLTTVGYGISITGGIAASGIVTATAFVSEKIIGDVTDEFPLGVIHLTPSLNDPDNGLYFVDNGQYINVYPTIADDAPHIHITAGILSTTSNYYDLANNYYKGDLFIGDDDNYLSIGGNGDIKINSNKTTSSIEFGLGLSDKNTILLNNSGNSVSLYPEGLDFDSDFCIAEPKASYVGTASSQIVYTSSNLYSDINTGSTFVGSMKLLIQCQGDGGSCQLSELLIVRPFDGTTVFMNETGRVTGIGTTAHVTFIASYNSGNIEVYADTSSDPNNEQWSFRIVPIEIRQYQD